MTDLVYVDTETLGLHPDAPVWEFAAIRVFESGQVDDVQFCINHIAGGWLDQLSEPFLSDYLKRYRHEDALDQRSAAAMIWLVTRDAHIVGAVPNFDTERLAKLLHRFGITPEWHYHLIDVENVVVGYLAAKGELLTPPWKSDDLSLAIGVDPQQFKRHTAMGDAEWCKAQWDAVMR